MKKFLKQIIIVFLLLASLINLFACQSPSQSQSEPYHECSYDIESVQIEPTCKKLGTKRFSCECGEFYELPISTITHIMGSDGNCTMCGRRCASEISYKINDDGVTARVWAYSDNDESFHHVVIQDTYRGLPVTSIGDKEERDSSVFSNDDFSTITIPDSIIYIANGAFSSCHFLKEITIPKNMKSINDSTFYNCWDLTTVNLPTGLEVIGWGAFYGCEKLTSIYFPNTLKEIGNFAFDNCSLTSVTIPNSVTHIGQEAFSSNDLSKIFIPKNVMYIDANAFSHNGLEMEDITFEDTSGWYHYGTPLTTVAELKAHLMNGKALSRQKDVF